MGLVTESLNLFYLSAVNGRLPFCSRVVRAPDCRGIESHIVQRWAADLAMTSALDVRIAVQDTL